MKENFNLKRVLVISLIVLGVVVLSVYCVDITRDRNDLRGAMMSVQDELASAREELLSTQNELVSTQDELTDTQDELAEAQELLTAAEGALSASEVVLAATQTELVATQSTLDLTQDDLDATEADLLSTQRELSSVQGDLATAEGVLVMTQQQLEEAAQERDAAQEMLAGLGITLSTSNQNYDANLVDNPDAVNPSWSELIDFLLHDQTENHTYVPDVYDCSEFSRDVHNNAEAAGIRAAVVHISFSNALFAHALNAFLTTDHGLVYVDCAGPPDTIARVERGEEYRAVYARAVPADDVRDDHWWDALADSDYYILVAYYRADYTAVAAVTSDIEVFW